MRARQIDFDLYLAVPVEAYTSVFRLLAADVIRENSIKMIIVDIEHEEVVEWLTN